MTFSFFPKRGSSKDEEDPNWNEEDDKALQDLRRALKDYYNGENIAQRSNKLATLKLFGSWDDEDEDLNNWRDEDVKAWRQFCRDMNSVDGEQARSRSIMYEQAEEEIAKAKDNLPSDMNIWPVAIVQNSVTLQEESMGKKKKKHAKKTPHVDVVFVSQDKFRCAYGIEVLATPKNRVQDVYAGQSLAKF